MTKRFRASCSLPRGTPFVVFGDDWGRNVSTMQHLFRHVAGQYPVLWVNGIGHRVPRVTLRDGRRAMEKAFAILRHQREGRVSLGDTGIGTGPARVVDATVLPWHHRAVVHRFNTWSLTRTIRRALHELGLHAPPVLVTGSPPSVGVVGRLAERAAIYFCMDDFLNMPTTSPEMLAPLEARLLERVDAVVATAESLTRSKRPASGRVYHLPQGVNYEHFATPRPRPADLGALPRPIIGFAGAFYDRCDFELFRRLADANPRGSLVLVGPVIDDPAPIRRPNVHLLGPRPYRELPAYVQAFDVGIVPYVLNEETVAVDPLKLLEYLAAGVPVVCTALPEARKYEGAVMIAADREAFVDAALAGAAEVGDGAARERRQATARRHGWARCAKRFIQICSEVAI